MAEPSKADVVTLRDGTTLSRADVDQWLQNVHDWCEGSRGPEHTVLVLRRVAARLMIVQKERDDARAALAAEPVAWMLRRADGVKLGPFWFEREWQHFVVDTDTVVPLYEHPERAEIAPVLNTVPSRFVVRMREGGGHEDVAASLAVTVAKLVKDAERLEWLAKNFDVLSHSNNAFALVQKPARPASSVRILSVRDGIDECMAEETEGAAR